MNTDTHLIQSSFFTPILDTMSRAGVNTKKLLQQSSLSRFDLSRGENYVPLNLVYKLMREINESQGIDNFYECFAGGIELQHLSDFGEIAAFAPDLLSAARFAEKNVSTVMTHERLQLEINGPSCKVSQWYVDAPRPGRGYLDHLDLCYLVNGFRIAMGPDWNPLEIHMQSEVVPDFENLFSDCSNIRILLAQPATALVFPTSILSAPMMSGRPMDSLTPSVDSAPESLSRMIEKLLTSSNNAQVANMGLMSDMLDVSPRTLRRRLIELDTTFSDVVEDWRFKSSLKLLEEGTQGVKEIAERLGYANTPNFDRAFSRWTGQSPRVYRESL